MNNIGALGSQRREN